jgi:hypothetical protein
VSSGAKAIVAIVVLALLCGVAIWWVSTHPRPGSVLDEARLAHRDAASFPAAGEDYFHDMDGAPALTPEEIRGRNTWVVWSAGNDRLWDVITVKSFGALDFLKVLSTIPNDKRFNRDTRWDYFGLVNEPCFEGARGPDANRFGLWLDTRSSNCPADPFEDETKYPGVKIGARGTTVNGQALPVGSFYGYATGIVGFRLFPNPDFDDKAAKKWDAVRYYSDPSYYNQKDLIRPYRVGMSCGLCHIGPNPVKPPADPNHPQWANLSSNVGAQYFWTDRIFVWDADDTNLTYQLFHTFRPGSLDTSLVSTDNINNPRTMNALYLLPQRLGESLTYGKEMLAGGGLNNKQINDYVKDGPMTKFFEPPSTVFTPRVLKDGADSVGVLGALNRVYLNIGTFSEEWLLHFNALVGGKPVTPITIAAARKNSTYFEATEAQTMDTARFFLKTTGAHKLADAPNGEKYLSKDATVLTRGKVAFAENCARCHSSKRPEPAVGLDAGGCAGKDYLGCWQKYWAWTETAEFMDKMRAIVTGPDFLTDNYLSTELRVPVTLLQTNACSPLATNALGGNIWDNFSSQSYKELPSVGTITWNDPYTAAERQYTMPAGGRGYTRPPSLVSLWSTAPFLLNNTVGRFDPDPSVEGRMRSFEDSIEKMLWPEKRDKDPVLKAAGVPDAKNPGLIDRIGDRLPRDHQNQKVYIRVLNGYLPKFVQAQLPALRALAPWLFDDEGIRLGPIPPGTPIGLLANMNMLSDSNDPKEQAAYELRVADVLLKVVTALKAAGPNASVDDARTAFKGLVEPLLSINKCPDFVVNRGHYFGSGLSDADKRALIEFLKTF